jgi:3,4-dehydroadipyl-CoA semialdehyde dehydrogenase
VTPGTLAFDAFVKEVAKEMTVKAGQKCTAIRRIFVPAQQANTATDALAARLAKVKVGDPRSEATRMGPLVTRTQQMAALEGIGRLAREAGIVTGGKEAPRLDGIDGAKSAFVAPTLLKAEDGSGTAVHDTEVFGPCATLIPYKDEAQAFALVARGGGSLVASVYGDDRDFLARAVRELAPLHGRILAVEPSIADAHTGHGIVMPQCNHGGPGRAGNGAELGGLYGLRFYHQRAAVQGSTELLDALQAATAPAH